MEEVESKTCGPGGNLLPPGQKLFRGERKVRIEGTRAGLSGERRNGNPYFIIFDAPNEDRMRALRKAWDRGWMEGCRMA